MLTFRKSIFLAALLFLSACVPPVFRQAYPISSVSLPEDEAAHEAPIEWWYWTGHFEDQAGTEYGFELTFFKAYAPPNLNLLGLPAWWFLEKGKIAHFAITDITKQTFEMSERTNFANYKGGASYEDLDVFVGDWTAKRIGEGKHQIKANVGNKTLELVLSSEKPVALHGNPPGIQSMGPGGTSYYLSYTRMSAEGTLVDCEESSCTEKAVSGQAWHDHQWGDFDLSSYAGWDWFSLQFEDNTELMLYLIREPSGRYSARAGSFVSENGRVIDVFAEDFSLIETGETWESIETGAIYPVQWDINLPSQDITIRVTPVMPEQEMNTRGTTGIVYWEGAIEITGSHEGKGYVELTNYDLYPYGQTDENTPLKPLGGPLGQ